MIFLLRLLNSLVGFFFLVLGGISDGIFKVKDPKITSFAIIAMLTGVVDWFRSDGVLTEYDLKQHYSILTRQMLGVNGPA